MNDQTPQPPPERNRWDLQALPVGESRWFAGSKVTGPQVRAAATYAAKKTGGRFRVAVSSRPIDGFGVEPGFRVWRVA